jgi:hypothetical protein
LFFYPPLVINYDPSIWVDKSNYTEWGENRQPSEGVVIENYLQAKGLTSCRIGVQGPTGFQQVTPEYIRLGDIRYEVITFTNSSNGFVGSYYIEDRSLGEYNYAPGLPILGVAAIPSEWKECKTLAEKVLSTLHVP